MRFADLVRIAVCPEVEERIFAAHYFPLVVMVSFTVLRQLFCLFPAFALVLAFPHDHFPSCSPFLWAVRRGANDHPVISLDKKATCIIILVRLGYFMVLPTRAIVDRKSTRLNSSHVKISYAVFCSKKNTPRL